MIYLGDGINPPVEQPDARVVVVRVGRRGVEIRETENGGIDVMGLEGVLQICPAASNHITIRLTKYRDGAEPPHAD